MPTPSSFAIIAAAKDPDLGERITAVMASMNVQDPDYDTQKFRRCLLLAQIETGGQSTTLADVYEYGSVLRDQKIAAREQAIRDAEAANPVPPDPGKDPAVVTDEQLRLAIQALIDQDKIKTS